MPSLPGDNITATIRRAVDIVELIRESVALTRRGRTFKGLCPFHDDHNPSFTVDVEYQNFKCWSCQKSGDVFDFVMLRDRVGFREALEVLAERAKISLPQFQPRKQAEGKPEVLETIRWAEAEFRRALADAEVGGPGREYLETRGISAESARTFRIGYAPESWDWLMQRARNQRITPEQLHRAGLSKRNDNRPGYHDYFRGRLMFPISDARGRTIAFGGRILPQFENEHAGKYTNSPETPIYTKGDHVYGLEQARAAIDKSRVAVVVEGNTDCIIPHQHGVTNIVGTLGTAVGEKHVRLLKRFATDRIVLVLDGDEAGQKAADRALGLFLGQEVDLRVCTLPDELDPCDFVLQRGADEFRKLVDAAPDALEFRLRRASELFNLSSLNGRREALDFMLRPIVEMPASSGGSGQVDRDIILDSLAQRLGIANESVRRRLRELREQHAKRNSRIGRADAGEVPSESVVSPWANETSVERNLMETLLGDPTKLDRITEQFNVDDLQTPGFRRMLEVCIEIHRDGEALELDTLRLRLDDRELACRASLLAQTGREKGASDQSLDDVLTSLKLAGSAPAARPASGNEGLDANFFAQKLAADRGHNKLHRIKARKQRHAAL